MDEETKAKYPKKIAYKGITYELDFVSKKYPNLVKYDYFDWQKKYFKVYSDLYYDNRRKVIVAVSYDVRGQYKIPLYDGYPSIGCDLTENLNFDLIHYLRNY